MPDISVPKNVPLAHATDHPAEIRVGGSARATDQAVLHLRKVAFEEADLVLEGGVWRIGVRPLHAEVVVDFARIDGGAGLGNQLGAAHVLAVPVRGGIDADFDALLGGSVGRVLIGRGEVDIFCDRSAAVDIVLVGPNLVAPRPFRRASA